MEELADSKWFLEYIGLIQKAQRAKGIEKDARGQTRFKEGYFTLDLLTSKLIEYGKNLNIPAITKGTDRRADVCMYWNGPVDTTPHEINKKFAAKVAFSAIYIATDTETNELLAVYVIPIQGLGVDSNDISFALGKALTYVKRYHLLGVLGLSDNIDPEDLKSSLKEVRKKLKDTYHMLSDANRKKYDDKLEAKYQMTMTTLLKSSDIEVLTKSIKALEKLKEGEING